MDIVTLGAALNGSAEYVNSHFKGGSNIQIVDNPDGTQTINASGEVSAEDTVARAEIVAIKDGENIDSFGDVETALDTKANTSTTYTKTEVDTALDDKVDKVSGKGLSTNDYTTAEKTKLAGIAEGAEVNEIESIKVNNTTINPDANKVVNITVPTTAADVSALPDTTKYAAALSLTINSSTFVMAGQLKDQNGDNLGTAQTIDLPLESVVVGGSYNSQTKKVVLTLQNGNTIEFSVADLVSGLQTELSTSNKLNPAFIEYDSTHRAVSDTEKSAWNSKQNALTTAQLAAVNSGINSTKVEQIENNENNISTVSDANGTKNLLDFNDWASKVNTTRATKSISGNSITLTATGKDAYTDGVAATCPASGKIACEPNTTYVITWETTSKSTSDIVYIFPANASPYYSVATTKYIEYTMPAGCRYFTFRFGVANSGDTVTYSNIMICEKSLYDISNQYKPYALSNAELTTKEQVNENNILSIQQEQIVQNADIATLRLALDAKIYGIRIDKQDANSDTRVTYLYDAVGMTPAYMDFNIGTFNYGSWADIWFVKNNRPVALKFDGTVDYELDHTDFTKKLDGTASDVSDPDYGGNFMSEMPTVYVKRWEDSRYNYIAFSDKQVNSDFLAQAHTNANGTVKSAIYLPMFKGWKDSNNKLRSLMGTYPTGNTTGANEVTYASNNGAGWQIWDKAKIDLLMDLIMLITKSTNCRAKIGNGDCQTYNASDTTNHGKMKSGYETDGTTRSASAQFYGSEGTEVTNYGKHHMIAFYIEDLWGNRWDRCLGFNLVDNVYKVKMTAPYVLNSDSSYETLTVAPPSSTTGWLKNVSSANAYGDVPTEVGTSSTSGFANYFYKNASGNRLSLFGGHAATGLGIGRSWALNNDSGDSNWLVGGSPCFNTP